MSESRPIREFVTKTFLLGAMIAAVVVVLAMYFSVRH